MPRESWLSRARGALAHLRRRGLKEQHPDLEWIRHVLSARSDDTVADGDLGYDSAAGYYAAQVWVSKAVRVWADSIAPLQVGVDHGDAQIDFADPVARLLAMPSPTGTAAELWRHWATDMALGGECGFEFVKARNGKLSEIYPRPPTYFAVRPDTARARYNAVASYVLDWTAQNGYVLPPSEFLHFKFYNPLNAWRGLAPLTAVRLGLQIDTLIQGWSKAFFTGGARPDFAVMAPAGLTKDEKDEILLQLARDHGDSDGWHSPMVLEQGIADIKPLSYQRKDVEWIQQRRLSRDEIGGVFGVPDEIMGYGRDTYENFDTAERVLWSLTLVNLVGFRDDALTHFFWSIGALASPARVRTDLSRVWALRRAAAVQLKDARALFSMGVPFNTLDERLGLGIGAIPGGEVGHVGASPANDVEDGGAARRKGSSGEAERSAMARPSVAAKSSESKTCHRLRALQDEELDVLRRLRSSRQLGRGKSKGEKIDERAFEHLLEVAGADAPDALLREIERGELAGESNARLQARVGAFYAARKNGVDHG